MELEDRNIFTITFPLYVEEWEADVIDRRLECLRHIYNNVQGKLIKYCRYLERFKAFREAKNGVDKLQFIIEHHSPYSFCKSDIIKMMSAAYEQQVGSGKTYRDLGISYNIANFLGYSAWFAWNRYFYGNGKNVLLRKPGEQNVIGSFCDNVDGKMYAGGFVLNFADMTVSMKINGRQKGHAEYITMPILTNKRQIEYEYNMLKGGETTVKKLMIVRKTIRGRRKYYLHLSIADVTIPLKYPNTGYGFMGIDIGPSNVAFSADDFAYFTQLPSGGDIDKKIARLQRAMERSSRSINPQNFEADGTTYRKDMEERTWIRSNRWYAMRGRLKELYRKRTAKRKYEQCRLASLLLTMANVFVVEDNNYMAWAKKSSKNTYSKRTGRMRTKHRWGKTIEVFAPASFIRTLEYKAKSAGGILVEVNTKNAASQFDFTNGKFTRHHTRERVITTSDGIPHNRDLLAAFNLQHLMFWKERLKQYDIDRMRYDYRKFCQLERPFVGL